MAAHGLAWLCAEVFVRRGYAQRQQVDRSGRIKPGWAPLSRPRQFAHNRSMLNSADPMFARLLDQARAMTRASTHPNATTLDVERWLTHWVTRPQPGLGGRRPEELLDTPGGVDAVARVLGAIESGVVV